jgi:nucleoside-diphosphate-sugar epimerase
VTGTGTVVITGASGFLGRHAIAHFLAAGRDVVALTRQPASLDDLQHPRLRVAATDYGASVARELSRGCSLIHLAAQRSMPTGRTERFIDANVRMPEALARQALAQGVRRFVLVSTALVLGPSEAPLDATGALAGWQSTYVRTRVEGLLAVERVAEGSLPLVTLLPPIIYGADHTRARNRITNHMRRTLRAPFRVAIGGPSSKRNLVHVDDVTRSLARAEAAQAPSGRHIVSGDNVTQDELESAVRTAAGMPPAPRIALPRAAALSAARIADALLRIDPAGGWTSRLETLLAPWCLRPYALPFFGEGAEPVATPFAVGIQRTVEALRQREH